MKKTIIKGDRYGYIDKTGKIVIPCIYDDITYIFKVSKQLGENNYYNAQIFGDFGTSYETVDDVMRRGLQK